MLRGAGRLSDFTVWRDVSRVGHAASLIRYQEAAPFSQSLGCSNFWSVTGGLLSKFDLSRGTPKDSLRGPGFSSGDGGAKPSDPPDYEKIDAGISKARMASPFIGLLAGVVGSVVGVGGGVLMVPMLSLFCTSIPQRIISGTTLAPVVSTGCTASLVYGFNGSVDFHSAALISISAILAAPLGAKMTMVVENKKLKRTLGYFLVSAGTLSSLQAASAAYFENSPVPFSGPEEHQDHSSGADGESEICPSVLFLAGSGLAAGFASGLLGIGGGTIITPLLAVATPMPQMLVLGTSLMATIPPSIVGLIQHHRLGNIDWVLGAGLAAGTLVGSLLGSNFALTVPDNVLKGIFAITMFALGRVTLAKAK